MFITSNSVILSKLLKDARIIFMANRTIREFYISLLGNEKKAFLAVLDAISGLPATSLEYKPDPKSKNGLELASLFANEFGMVDQFLDTGKWSMEDETHIKYTNVADIKKEAERAIDSILAKASKMSEEDWNADAIAWASTTKGAFAMDLLLDLIHHRGQLSTYIRAMGGKNPSIYGPTADVSMEELMK